MKKWAIEQANISEVEEKEEVLALMVCTQGQKEIKQDSITEGGYSSESRCKILAVMHRA